MSFHSPQQCFCRFYRLFCQVEKKNGCYCFSNRTTPPIFPWYFSVWSSPTSCQSPSFIPAFAQQFLHPFCLAEAGICQCAYVSLCVLYVGGWRVPEWLSPQMVKEAHGKFAAWSKPQAFSIISADFSFLVPFKKAIIADCTFFGFILPALSRGFLGFPRHSCTLLINVQLSQSEIS